MLNKPSEIVEAVLNYIPIDVAGKGKLPGVLPQSVEPVIMRAMMRAFSRRDDTNNTTTDPLKQFMNYLQKKGIKKLDIIASLMIVDLNITRNITPMLEVVTNDYLNLMQNYYEFVKKNQNESERDLLYLDMVETSCRSLYNEEKKLLNDIIMHENLDAQGENYQKMAHELLRLSKKDRKQVMRYVCETYQVCRTYPAFSDYLADLMSDVIILDDKRFRVILEALSRILQQNEKVFAKFAEKTDIELIGERLRSFPDTYAVKEFFGVVRSVLKQRYKTVSSGNEEFKAKTKATSIILDIIDKAFTTEDDLIAIDFDNTIQAIRHWSANRRLEIEALLEEFARSMFRRLNHNLTSHARRELKVLIKTVMRGTQDDEGYRRSLFKSGSKYVKGKDFYHDEDVFGS